MTKAELIDKLHQHAGDAVTKKACSQLVDALFDNIATTIKKEGRFAYPGFGTFVIRKRKARKGRNPQTGAPIKIKARNVVKFKAGKGLKTAI